MGCLRAFVRSPSCCWSCWWSISARKGSLDGARPMAAMRGIFSSRLAWASLLIVAIAATLPLYVSAYILGLLTLAYYFGVFAMSWDLLFGFAGEVNFGPTFLIGLGAYTAVILNIRYGLPIPTFFSTG